MNSSHTNCILHIGFHKTGTTAVQDFLINNQKALEERGFVYPESYTLWNGHHRIPWSLGVYHSQHNPSITLDTIIRDYVAKMNEKGGDYLIISSEDMEFLTVPNIEKLRRSLEEHSLKPLIIAYVRRQDEYLLAEYKQHLKMKESAFAGSLDDFYMKYNFDVRFNYLNTLRGWENVFGKENLFVRCYDRAGLIGGDIRKDFCNSIGLSDVDLQMEGAPSNISQRDITSHVLSYANELSISPAFRVKLIEVLDSESKKTGIDISLFPKKKRMLLLEKYKKLNAELVSHYQIKNGESMLTTKIDYINQDDAYTSDLKSLKLVVSALVNVLDIQESSDEKIAATG